MRSPAITRLREGLGRASDLNDKDTFRSILTRSRRIEQGIDYSQLPVTSSKTLVRSDGKFFFLVGYSMVGGPDVVDE